MKYYQLETSHNLKVMGRQPFQIQNFRKGYDKNAENSIYKFVRTNLKTVPEKGPDLEGMIMEKGAKWTDNVACIPIEPDFVINKKIKDIFTSCHLPPQYAFYLMSIFHKKFEDTRIYYFFHLPYDDFYEETQNEKIDYKNSIFEFQPIPSDRYLEKKITSHQQFRKILENHNLKVKLLKLKRDFQVDIFRVWPLGVMISEKVKTILEEEEITGFSFVALF